MRELVYSVATSLDGFIAGPNGEYDWIIQDPTVDFGEVFRQFDTVLMGRICYEGMLRFGRSPKELGMKAYVASTTLNATEHPAVSIISTDLGETVRDLKCKSARLSGSSVEGSRFAACLMRPSSIASKSRLSRFFLVVGYRFFRLAAAGRST